MAASKFPGFVLETVLSQGSTGTTGNFPAAHGSDPAYSSSDPSQLTLAMDLKSS